MHDLRPDNGVDRRLLGGLQDHGAAGGQGRQDLAGDLVDRPVPRRDQAAHADRLAHDQGGALDEFERVGFEHLDHALEMGDAAAGLDIASELLGCPHLARDGVADIVAALLVEVEDRAQQVEALLARAVAEAREGGAGGGDGAVDVGGAADRDLGVGFLGRGIDDVQQLGRDRFDPFAVDVELLLVLHGTPLGKLVRFAKVVIYSGIQRWERGPREPVGRRQRISSCLVRHRRRFGRRRRDP